MREEEIDITVRVRFIIHQDIPAGLSGHPDTWTEGAEGFIEWEFADSNELDKTIQEAIKII
jgi:hypothetical protein